MKPGLTRTRVAAANACKAPQPLKGAFYQAVADGFVLPRLEEMPVVLIPSPWRGQILPKEPNNIPPERNKPGFVEFRPADGDHGVIEVHVRKTQPNGFPYAHAGSIEE
jgi:hypothetical protein